MEAIPGPVALQALQGRWAEGEAVPGWGGFHPVLPQALGFSRGRGAAMGGMTKRKQRGSGLPYSPPATHHSNQSSSAFISLMSQVEGVPHKVSHENGLPRDNDAKTIVRRRSNGSGSHQTHWAASPAAHTASSRHVGALEKWRGHNCCPQKSLPSSLSQDTGQGHPRTRVSWKLSSSNEEP